ncbi:LysR family transcriptional regulator [Shimia sp. SDUM112013]|uniref:LysR family transcriptional regulator n=1 Tax=Shimia sp. SDUM112013 TaxID=3136160 RepID=UPI0032EDCDA1
MPISFRQIEVFRSVMMAGSVTAAARLMNSSQPTVSRDLKRLEDLAGFSLFHRRGGKLYPTTQALSLLEQVKRSYRGLDNIQRTITALRQNELGSVTITCLPALAQSMLPAALAQFHSKPRQITVAIETADLLDEKISDRAFDLGIVEVERALPGTIAETLVEVDEVCVLPTAHPLATQSEIAPEDLHGQDFVFLSPTDPYRKRLDEVFAAANVERRIAAESTSAATACALVRRGFGIAIVNPFSAFDLQDENMIVRRFTVSSPFRVTLLRPANRALPPPVEELIEALRTTCSDVKARVEAL